MRLNFKNILYEKVLPATSVGLSRKWALTQKFDVCEYLTWKGYLGIYGFTHIFVRDI